MLRILCFNIHGGYSLSGKRDLRVINSVLETLNIDIAVFQEMETRTFRGGTEKDAEIIAGPERPHRLFGANIKTDAGWYGNLLVSRYPIVKSQVHNLGTSARYEPRGAVDALIETPIGKIRIIGTHLSLNALERWSEVNNLIKLIDQVERTEKHPVFVMGDLNEWSRRGKLLKYLNSLMTPLPCAASFPSFCPVLKLDRVWCDTPGIKAHARTLKDKAVRHLSDHLPLLIEIETLQGT